MKTFVHFVLSYVLFMTSALATQVGEQSTQNDTHGYRKAVHKAVSDALTQRYVDQIHKVNSYSKSPKSLVRMIPKADKQNFINYIEKHKITHFPKFVREGNYFVMKIQKGLTLKMTPKSMHKWEFWVNDKKHSLKGKKSFTDLVTWLEHDVFANRTSSLMSLFVNEAHAAAGVLIFFAIVGVVAVWAIMSAGEMLQAEQNSKDLRKAHAKLKKQHRQCSELRSSGKAPGVDSEVFSLVKKFDQKFVEDGGWAYFDQEARFKSDELNEMIYESNSYGKDIADDCEEFGTSILQGLIGGLLSRHRSAENLAVVKEYGCDSPSNKKDGKWDAEKLEACFQSSVCAIHRGLDSCLEDVWEKHNEYREKKSSRSGKRYNPNRGIFGNDPNDEVNSSSR